MSSKVFRDNVFPNHVSDLMSLMHMVVFEGTDGEEKWDMYLTLEQKECIALGLALYYQCDHCIEHHTKALSRLNKRVTPETLDKNMNAIILFLRTETSRITHSEKKRWIQAWQAFSIKMSLQREDKVMPYLLGLAIGLARNDTFLIEFCGVEVKAQLEAQGIDARLAIGELESVVIFMKAAASKNRVAQTIGSLFNK